MKLSAFKTVAGYFLCCGLWFLINQFAIFYLKPKLNAAQFELLVLISPYGIILIFGLLLFKLISLNNQTFKITENDYLNLYLGNPNPLWIYDPVSFKFLSVNDAAVAHYGYTRQEFLTMTIKDIRAREDVEKLIGSAIQVAENQFSSGIWRHLKKDGTLIYVKTTSHKINFNKKKSVMVLATDTTEQVVYEQKLQHINQVLLEEKQKLKETEKLAKVSGWEYFVKNDMLIWSDELYEIFEMNQESEKVSYSTVVKSVHPEDLFYYNQTVENLLKYGKDLDVCYRFITKTGNTKYVKVLGKMQYQDGKMYKVHGTMQDVTELKLVQQEKNTYQQRLKSTLTNISNGYFMLNRSWIITAVNNNCENMLMVKKEQMLNRNYLIIFPRAKNLKFYTYFKKVLEEGVPVNFEEYDIYLKKWFCVNAYPTDEGVGVYFEDITEDKKKDLQLKEALERYDLVAKATRDVVYDFDILNNYITYSNSMADLLDITKAEIGNNLNWWKSKIHADDLGLGEAKYKTAVAAKQKIFEYEYRIKTSSGQYKYVFDQGYLQYDEQGNYSRLIGAIKDIDHLKQVDAENKRLADIITKVNNMIVIQNTDHKITWVNKAFENATGYTLCEVAGKYPEFLQGPETDLETAAAIIANKKNYNNFSYDIINYTKQRKKYWVNIEFTPLFTSKGEPDGYISIHNDITLRKQKGEKISRQNEILRNIAWMSSHELRRPVASILGLIDLINETADEEDKTEPIKMLQTCTQHLDEIIHKINHRIEQEISEE
ncbi:MAG: PAS domain S-box protein [Sphingobacteriaceae bacterium]|nr:MAG: PAS domain S-box protein [Sphingobacteriaceae bacterium]